MSSLHIILNCEVLLQQYQQDIKLAVHPSLWQSFPVMHTTR